MNPRQPAEPDEAAPSSAEAAPEPRSCPGDAEDLERRVELLHRAIDRHFAHLNRRRAR